ncbi:hypothetical protein BJX65DRAFT_308995 [Aspergillus insuetus]
MQPSGISWSTCRDGGNTLGVRVYEFCDGSYLERQDQWLLSGIFQDVYLVSFPRDAIMDWGTFPELDDSFTEAALRTSVADLDTHGFLPVVKNKIIPKEALSMTRTQMVIREMGIR